MATATQYVSTPFGILVFQHDQSTLWKAEFCDESGSLAESPWHFAEFLAHPWTLRPAGTPFQQQVWEMCLQIPMGTTATYGELAQRLGKPGAARAVGNALAHNPIALLIPCHRILQKKGSRSGYRWGTERKLLILAWEASYHLQ